MKIENENTRGVAGYCLDIHDLAISKYVAGRPKDLEFTRALARHKMTRLEVLLERLAKTKLSRTLRPLVRSRIGADFPRKQSE